jgi:hypothetical protein
MIQNYLNDDRKSIHDHCAINKNPNNNDVYLKYAQT